MSAPRSRESKIKPADRLRRDLARLRKSRKKTVFTNGCFDLLHKGHVSYLERARRLGDALVVALNTDSSVRKLKGVGRPVNPLRDRLEVIAALESVDYVTWFADRTPLRLINQLRPDVLVKGGDWKAGSIIGAREVNSWGGKVRALPFVAGRSTTRTIRKMRKAST